MLENMLDGIYIVAVSGGSDSMALLHMAIMKQLSIVVCHVNYHRRKSSDRDEAIVRSFCALHHIRCEVLHAKEESKGNFQDYARTLRYDFFRDIYESVDAVGLLSAHHRDDHLETAILRQRQKRKVDYYGIRKDTMMHGMRVLRPLLDYWKSDLMNYCIRYEIPYGEDESNAGNNYERNRIRHNIIGDISADEKNNWIASFDQKNMLLEAKQLTCNFILNQLEYREQLPLLVLQSSEHKEYLVRTWLTSMHEKAYILSEAKIQQIVQLASSDHGHKVVELFEDYVVNRGYDTLYFQRQLEDVSFCHTLNQIKELTTPWFKVRMKGNLKDGITVKEEDFPLTIRNVRPGDTIHFSFGHKKMSRYFIDRKIPISVRKAWPVVCNKKNEVIFACGIGSSYEYFTNTPNLFVVK